MTALITVAPKLRKLLPLLASDKAGEVVATAAAITRTLKQAGADLHDLAKVLGRAEPHGTLEPVCWRDIPALRAGGVARRDAHQPTASPWEQDFCSSILAQVRYRPWSALSPKQVAILDRCIPKIIAEAQR